MEDQQPVHQDQPIHTRPSVSFPGAPQPKKKNVWLKVVILLVLLLVIGGVAWFLLSNENPFSKATTTPTPTITVRDLPTNTPLPSEAPAKKEDLKIMVQNGTGVPGEAAFLQKEMEKLGFKSIETGNADNTSYTKTQVSFATRVPDDVKTEVTTKLQALYATVDVTDAPAAGSDITIVTGPRKGQKATVAPTSVQGTKTSITPTKPATTGTGATGTKAPTSTPTPA